MADFLVHAEFCDGPFYMGWWIYCDPIINGRAVWSKKFISNGGSRWYQGLESWNWGSLRSLILYQGPFDPPVPLRYTDRLAEWFHESFPLGIRVVGTTAYDWSWEASRIETDPSILLGWPFDTDSEQFKKVVGRPFDAVIHDEFPEPAGVDRG